MKKKVTLLSILILVLGLILYVMLTKGFFEDPQNFMYRAENKVSKLYHQITGIQPKIQEEIIATADGHQVLIDRPKGYTVSFPEDMKFDLTASPELIRASNDVVSVTVTREWAPYPDVWYFVDHYLNNYYLDDHYMESNNITIRENKKFLHKEAESQLISLYRTPTDENAETHPNEYTYFYVLSKTGPQAFFRMMFKYQDYDAARPVMEEVIASFEEIRIEGVSS